MSKSSAIKKAISSRLNAFATKTFEHLSHSKSTKKTAKIIGRNAKRLTKAIHGLVKKVEKKKAKQAKTLSKAKAKQAKARAQNSKVSRRTKTTGRVKKVRVN